MSSPPGHRLTVLDTPATVLEARRLMAVRYLDAGFVDSIPASGVVVDEWLDESTYFGVIDEADHRIVATARLIRHSDRRLPVLQDLELDDAGRKWLGDIPDNTIAELSALAIEPGRKNALQLTRHLYRAMSRFEMEDDGRLTWLAALDVRVLRLLERTLGLSVTQLGPQVWYRGGETVPVGFNVVEQFANWRAAGSQTGDFFLEGLLFDPSTRTVAPLDPRALAHVPPLESTYRRAEDAVLVS